MLAWVQDACYHHHNHHQLQQLCIQQKTMLVSNTKPPLIALLVKKTLICLFLPWWLELQKGKTLSSNMRSPGSCGWWSKMLANGILVAEQSVTWKPKSSCDLQHSILALIRLDGQLERPYPIIQLVMIVSIEFFKLFLQQTRTQSSFIWKVLEGSSRESIALRLQYLKPFNCVQVNEL